MAKATAHPDRRLISSEDVEGTEVYGFGDEVVGEIDHLLIEKVSGRVAYAVMSFGGFLGLAHSHYPYPGRRSNMIPRSVAIVPGSVKSSLEMLRPSATNSWTRPGLGDTHSSTLRQSSLLGMNYRD